MPVCGRVKDLGDNRVPLFTKFAELVGESKGGNALVEEAFTITRSRGDVDITL